MVSAKCPKDRLARQMLASSGILSVLLNAGILATTAEARSVVRPDATVASVNSKNFSQVEGSGTLVAMLGSGKRLGNCPLKHTSVTAKVSGFVSRVTVKQTFTNPFKDKIEAVYTFPLSERGAVDEMLMKVGERTIHGTIKRREEARQIYDNARAAGHVAALLDQERPNIFTQSVANIEPGKTIEVTLQYIETLPYEDGKYSFVFPTVVGPRFNPPSNIGFSGTGREPDTTTVPDASHITPPIAPKGERAGHDISISVDIAGGVPISDINSSLHEIAITNQTANSASISLVDKNTIPNRDFVLKWDVAGDSIKSGCLTYRDPKSENKSGYFSLMLVPPKRVTPQTVAPKEMIFLIDCSGSQSGAPLNKAKETLTYIMEHMNANDTFQIISFNNRSEALFSEPKRASTDTKYRAKSYIRGLQARGGTWMAPAVEAVIKQPADNNRLRIVTFMTDGYVGNDMEILGMIKKYRGQSRWFSFGTGNSVNRFLIDGIAKEGGGEAEYVLLNSPAGAVGKKFYDRISSPVLTDVKVAFEGVEVKEVFPKDPSDVWAQKPLYIEGRYLKPGSGKVTLSGFQAGKPYSQVLNLNFPAENATNSGIASIWARAKVDRMMSEDWFGAQLGNPDKELKEEIVKTALDHHIMTQYTSFVAVDEKHDTAGGAPRLEVVPVDLPAGLNREASFDRNFFGPSVRRTRQSAMFHNSNGMASFGAARRSEGFATPSPLMAAPSRAQVIDQRALPATKPIIIPEAKQKPKIEVDDSEEQSGKDIGQFKKSEASVSAKIDPALQQLIATKGEEEKISVKITLSTADKKVLDLLKKAGLENATSINIQGNRFTVTGSIRVAKLLTLAKLIEVTFIQHAK